MATITVAPNNKFVTIMPKRKTDQLTQDAEDLYEALNQLVRVYQFRDRDRICC